VFHHARAWNGIPVGFVRAPSISFILVPRHLIYRIEDHYEVTTESIPTWGLGLSLLLFRNSSSSKDFKNLTRVCTTGNPGNIIDGRESDSLLRPPVIFARPVRSDDRPETSPPNTNKTNDDDKNQNVENQTKTNKTRQLFSFCSLTPSQRTSPFEIDHHVDSIWKVQPKAGEA
jgi:hypothetical protein